MSDRKTAATTNQQLLVLAAEKVRDFKRPVCWCSACTEPADTPGKIRDEYGQWLKCWGCDGSGCVVDDSPAALLMAVAVYCSERALTLEIDEYHVLVSAYARSATADLDSASPRTIARAALVALLRAHGVEVSDDD